ncbi:MAG: glycoside hydrolase family 15 protein [Candidatus Omnitrophota bacterium]
MPRDIPVGNGSILVAFDKQYLLREFYFPHVGEENHTKGEPFRFGVWVDGIFDWLPAGWDITADYLDDTLATLVIFTNNERGIRITVNDLVDFNENIYLKKISVENLSDKKKEVRLFLAQDFHILGSSIGDTAAFRPGINCLLHYKGERYFLINVYANNKFGIDHFATGNKEQHGQEGTWRDAEDGVLSKNEIAQGAVDSVAGIYLQLEPLRQESCYYWICAAKNWNEASALNALVQKKRPEAILKRTVDYWKLWVDKEKLNYGLLPEKLSRLYKRSLLIVRTQIDNDGSIIAGNDSDVVYFNRDTYSYMWPRDAALAAYSLDLAGYPEITSRFFNLCAHIIEKEGYFLHKYTPSGMLASSWHPWQKDDLAQLPIQEDETALVVWALWHHFDLYKDIELIKPLYKTLIKSAADFMMNYRDTKTRLPLPSYDLWEERRGVFTYTASTVYAGLMAAANFTEAFGETGLTEEYRAGAGELRAAMDKYLYLEEEKRFCRMIGFKKSGEAVIDASIDASLYGVFAFGAYGAGDEKVKNTMSQVYRKLWCRTPVGGLARYENDTYYRKAGDVPGNPWLVTTLWYAQYLISAAGSKAELEKALPVLEWACDRALQSGVLAEQVDPHTGEPLSVSPLTWSHAAYIAAVQEYLNKLIAIEKCTACNQSKFSKKRVL